MYANAVRWYAISLAQAGRHEEAGQMIQRWRDITRSTAEKAYNAYPMRDPGDLEHYRDGLRKAHSIVSLNPLLIGRMFERAHRNHQSIGGGSGYVAVTTEQFLYW